METSEKLSGIQASPPQLLSRNHGEHCIASEINASGVYDLASEGSCFTVYSLHLSICNAYKLYMYPILRVLVQNATRCFGRLPEERSVPTWTFLQIAWVDQWNR